MSGQTQQGVETNLYHKESLYDINSSSTNIYGSFILLFIALLVLLYVCDCWVDVLLSFQYVGADLVCIPSYILCHEARRVYTLGSKG